MKIRRILPVILIAVLSLAADGCSDSGANKSDNKIVNVEVQEVKIADGKQVIAYSGTLEESETIPLSFSVMGSVSRVLVSEGDHVKKGTLLAVINDESYKNSYEMSLAALKQAEDAYKRLQPMYKNGNLPEIKLVEVETSLQQAKSATAIAKKNVDDCRLYSPVEGVVGKRSIDPGMNVMPGLSTINIVKIEKVFARVAVSENEIAAVKKGGNAAINVGALNNEQFTGTIEEIGVMADPIAHTYKIKIGIFNKNGKLKPGMICNVQLQKQSTSSEGLVIAGNAVMVDNEGKNYVYRVDKNNNKAFRVYVKTGKLYRDGIEITEGLKEGDFIVITGQQKLVDNLSVHIVNG